jgi:hypothetical protein
VIKTEIYIGIALAFAVASLPFTLNSNCCHWRFLSADTWSVLYDLTNFEESGFANSYSSKFWPKAMLRLRVQASSWPYGQGRRWPDISSVDTLKRVLLQANSIAYSSSVSGDYLSTEPFQRLGIADQIIDRAGELRATRKSLPLRVCTRKS